MSFLKFRKGLLREMCKFKNASAKLAAEAFLCFLVERIFFNETQIRDCQKRVIPDLYFHQYLVL